MLRYVFTVIAFAYWLLSPFAPHALADDFRGGDGIVCEPTRENEFVGMYNLDYLLTYNSATDNSDVPEVSSVEASLEGIANKVRVIPKLYHSIRDFVQLRENYTDYSQERIWEIASFGLIPITGRPILRHLPPNCYSEESAAANIVQAIVKAPRGDHGSTYLFDPVVLDHLEATSPLQLSFMLAHEWLWDFTDDVLVNRKVTRFLHSTTSAGLSADELAEALGDIGLDLMTPVCRRSETVRDAIERYLRKECHEISREELATIDRLRLRIRSTHLRAGDFDGLSGLSNLRAGAIGLETLPPGLEQTNIEVLNLAANHISALDRPLPPRIVELHLFDNNLTTIPAGFLERYRNSLYKINLSSNQLETFTYIGGLSNENLHITNEIDVSSNNLRAIRVHNVFRLTANYNPTCDQWNRRGTREFRNIEENFCF